MKKFLPLWLVIFMSFFCYSSMLTMFVPLLQGKLSPLNLSQYSASYRNILSGIYLSLYPLGQFFGSPIIGALSDKFGRKNMLSISLIITILCLTMIAYAVIIKSMILLAIACFVAGLGESNMALALSAISDLTTPETHSSEFARAFVMCSLGYISGSIFGGIATWVGYIHPFIIEAILVAITLASILIFFNDNVKQKTSHNLKVLLLSFFSIFHKKVLRPYYLANFLAYLACFGILRVELIYMQDYFLLSQFQISMFYSYASIIAMIANFIVTPYLLKKLDIRRVILFTGSGAFISSIIFILPKNPEYLWLTTALIGFFVPIIVAMLSALISGKAIHNQQGAVMGNNQSLQVLAEAVSAAAGGVVFAVNRQLPFITFAIIGFVSIVIYRQLKH